MPAKGGFRVSGKRNRWVTFDCYGTLVKRTSWPVIRPFDDVEPLLAELRLRGYRLGVLTNCDDAQFEAAHRSFRRPFDLFVTAERIRGYKPEPWHFRAFQRMTQVRKRLGPCVVRLARRHRPGRGVWHTARVARP